MVETVQVAEGPGCALMNKTLLQIIHGQVRMALLTNLSGKTCTRAFWIQRSRSSHVEVWRSYDVIDISVSNRILNRRWSILSKQAADRLQVLFRAF